MMNTIQGESLLIYRDIKNYRELFVSGLLKQVYSALPFTRNSKHDKRIFDGLNDSFCLSEPNDATGTLLKVLSDFKITCINRIK